MRATAFARWLPGLANARQYRRTWLRDDLAAGVVLTALLIPAGIGYAEAAGLPPVTGLYATVVPLLVYAAFGPSPILVLGPDSALAPIIAASVLPMAAGDPQRAVALAGLLALLTGVILVVGGLLRLGFVMDLLSKPIRIGYLNGIGLVVVIGQLPKLLGFSGESDSLLGKARVVVDGIADGAVGTTALAIGLGSLVLILAARATKGRVPGIPVVVVASVLITAMLGWRDRLPVVGALPQGLPAPALEGLRWGDVIDLAGPAFGIALITFADSGVLSRTLAARRGRAVDGS